MVTEVVNEHFSAGSLQMSPKMELCLLMNSIQQCIW